MPPNSSKVVVLLKAYDRWFLAIGLVLCAVGYFVASGSAAFWLLILGGVCIGASTYLNMAWGVKQERESREP
jgi:hypothetical protein